MKQNFQRQSPPSPNCFIPSAANIDPLLIGGEILKAVILAGGFATRLRPLSCTRPKILFPIANKPLLQWTFERLSNNGIKDIVLAVFYQTEVHIRQHRIPKYGLHISYSHDPLRMPLGTAGSIKRAEKRIGHSGPFVVLNGDIFADINYADLLQMHRQKDAVATIALHSVDDPTRYGVAKLDQNNRVVQFVEKPPAGTAPTNLINAGVYALSPKIFTYIRKGRTVSIEREIFPKLAHEGVLYGHITKGTWSDIGKPQDYLEINRKILISIPQLQENRFGKGIELKRPVAIGRDVRIGERSVIGPKSILGRGVIIGKCAHIIESVILPRTVISDFSIVKGAIIGEGVTLGESAKIEEGCVIGDNAKIAENVSLASGTKICPAEEVSKSVLTPNII